MICIFIGDLRMLYQEARVLVHKGLKANTQKTYTAAQRQYMSFCKLYSLSMLPASEDQLLSYVAFLHRRELSASTISVYLAAVRSLHVSEGYQNPLKDTLRLQQALRGIGLEQKAPVQKFPITADVLSQLSNLCTNYDSLMIWTAMNVGYFGLFRAGEICVTGNKFDPKLNLCLSDVVLVPSQSLTVFVKRSKTDRHNQGVHVHIGCSQQKICAVCTMETYISQRSALFGNSPQSPLFVSSSGLALTRAAFNSHIKAFISKLGKNPSHYSGHSLRAGGASDAAKNGLSEWEIKLMGRWTSDAYERYIRLPVEYRYNFARKMIH